MGAQIYTWTLFGLYIVVTSGLAYSGMRKTSSLAGFAIGNQDMSPVLVGITLAASVASTATFVINPGFVYAHGVSALLHFGVAATSGVTAGLIIMSKGFRRYGDKSAALTLPHWLGARYESPTMRSIFALLNILLAISFVVLIVKGSALVMSATLGLGYTVSVLLIVGFVFSYILLGGTYAHAYTNSLQGSLMVVVAMLIVGSGLALFGDGIGAFFAQLEAKDANLVRAFNPASALYSNGWEVLITPFVIGFGLVCQPHILTKALYLKSTRDVNVYLVVAAVIGFIFASILLVGLFARITLPAVPSQDAVMAVYIQETFTPLLSVPISIALLAAGMSTMDGILVSASTIAGNDLFLGALGTRLMPNHTEEERGRAALRASRLILVVMGVLALILALNPPRFVGLFAQFGVYGIVAASLAPVSLGIFVSNLHKQDALGAALAGLATHFFHYAYLIGLEGRAFSSINPAITACEGVAVSFVVLLGGKLVRHTLRARRARATGA